MKKYTAFLISVATQVIVLSWFNLIQCGIFTEPSFKGESQFVGGLGWVYVVILSWGGGLIFGALAIWLPRRKSGYPHL